MFIKRKSLIVALVSGIIISLVLILTLIGYFMYIEFRGEELKRAYQDLLQKAKAKVYSKYIDITMLDARIENTGPLKGKPIVEGAVTNKGKRPVADLVIKINFMDNDNVVLYELTLHPQEPVFEASGIAQVVIPYLYNFPRSIIKPNETVTFKKIMTKCPTEVFVELREGRQYRKSFGKWPGKLTSQVISLDF